MGFKIAAALIFGCSIAMPARAIASDFDRRGYSIEQKSVDMARQSLLQQRSEFAARFSSITSDIEIADDLARYCEARSMGYDDAAYHASSEKTAEKFAPLIDRESISIRLMFQRYRILAIVPTAKASVCPQFDD